MTEEKDVILSQEALDKLARNAGDAVQEVEISDLIPTQEELNKLARRADEAQDEVEAPIRGAKAHLMSRLQNRFIPVVFEKGNDGETFTINMYVPEPAHKRRLYAIKAEVLIALEAENEEKLNELDDEWAGHLEQLCVDPALNREFWKAGKGFDSDVPARLMDVAMGLDDRSREAARFFRSLQEGRGSSTAS